MTDQGLWFDVLMMTGETLEHSSEFALGMRELRRRLPVGLRWYHAPKDRVQPVAEFLAWSEAPLLLVILNPAIGVSDNLVEELSLNLRADDGPIECVLPADQRVAPAGITPDYANRSGFDRFVNRLGAVAGFAPYDGRAPWIYLVRRSALEKLQSTRQQIPWDEVPALLGQGAAIAQHAFVHSYADYYANNRVEMLNLVPADTRTLLDVGGGEGRFARTFMAERGGQATLLELNPHAAEKASAEGVEVLTGDFESLHLARQFDCVTFLDVLEHMDDPFSALLKAHQLIRPGGSLLLSVPNVGHWSVVSDLLEGRFDYLPVGILCNTHKYFFTRSSMETLLDDAGYAVKAWHNVELPMSPGFESMVSDCCLNGVKPDRESLATMGFYILAGKISTAGG